MPVADVSGLIQGFDPVKSFRQGRDYKRKREALDRARELENATMDARSAFRPTGSSYEAEAARLMRAGDLEGAKALLSIADRQAARRQQADQFNRRFDADRIDAGKAFGQKERAQQDRRSDADRRHALDKRRVDIQEQRATRDRGRLFEAEGVRDAALQLGKSPEEASDIAAGRKSMSPMEILEMARKIVSTEMPAGDFRVTPEQRQARMKQVAAELGTMLNTAQRRTPDTGVGQRRGDAGPSDAITAPGGSGTRQAPFQATTQDHIEWFKQSAPKGAIISINGKLYQK